MSFDFQPQNHTPVEFQPPKVPILGNLSLVVFLTAGLALAGVIAWAPLVNAFKVWMARSHASEAVTSLEADELGHAIAELIEAKKWAPQDPEVLKALIIYMDHINADPRELAQTLRLLASKESLSGQHQIIYGTALIATGQLKEAREVHARLPASSANSPEAFKLLSRLRRLEGQGKQAEEATRQALQLDKDSPEARLALALQNATHAFPEFRDGSWNELWALTAIESKTGIDAIIALSRSPRLKADKAQLLLELVENHPHYSLPTRLTVVSALIRLLPDQRDQLIEREIELFQNKQNGNLIDLANWLSEHRQYARLLSLIPSNLASSSSQLYTTIIKSLAAQERWQDIKTMLKDKRPPVTNTLATIWLADAESHLQPNLGESRRLLSYAIAAAAGNGENDELELAGRFAEKLGMNDLALKACIELAEAIPNRKNALLRKARDLALVAADSHTLLQVSHELCVLNPSNPSFADHYAYFRLLFGAEMETIDLAAIKRTSFIVGESPAATEGRIPVSLLEAMAAYRFKNKTSLAAHLARLPVVDGLTPGQRAVLSGMLASEGNVSKAFQIAEKVPAVLLLDEERSFLKLAR